MRIEPRSAARRRFVAVLCYLLGGLLGLVASVAAYGLWGWLGLTIVGGSVILIYGVASAAAP